MLYSYCMLERNFIGLNLFTDQQTVLLVKIRYMQCETYKIKDEIVCPQGEAYPVKADY